MTTQNTINKKTNKANNLDKISAISYDDSRRVLIKNPSLFRVNEVPQFPLSIELRFRHE